MKKILSLYLLCAVSAFGQVTFTNISVGTSANDGTGDTLRTMAVKINAGFSSVSNYLTTNGLSGSVTATGSTTARTLQARFADQVSALDHGLTDDGSTDNSSAANTMFANSAVAKKVVRFTKSASGTGVYLFNSTVNITNDVHIIIDPGVTIKRGNTATSYTWWFRVPQTIGIRGGVFDGNKANNSLSANRYPMVRFYGTSSAVIEGGYTTNHITGFYDVDSSQGWTMRNWGFFNAAEHEGTYSADAYHHTEAVNVSIAIADARPHFKFENITIKQDAAPSATGKAPGGIIVSGNIASNCLVSVTVDNLIADGTGQTYPRSGDANHVAAGFHGYEWTQVKISNSHGRNNKYGFIHVQNSLRPTIVNVTVEGMDSGILESEGTAGVLVDVNRTLGDASTHYGGANLVAVKVKDVGNVAGIRIAGRGSASADEYLHASLTDCEVDNAGGRALQIIYGAGKFTITGGHYKGQATGASGGAVEIQNFDSLGQLILNGVNIAAYAFNGLYAASGFAGSLSISGGSKISNGGAGTTALVANVTDRLSLRSLTLDGTGGGSYTITGAGTLEWSGVNVVAGTKSITWANVGNAEGLLEGIGTPEASVKAVKGRALYLRTDGGTGTTLYVKESDSGSADNTGWVAVAASAGSGDDVFVNGSTVTHPDFDDSTYLKFIVTGTNVTAYPTNITAAQIAAMTSADLRGVVSDESGTGDLIFQHGNMGSGTAAQPSLNDDSARIATTGWVLDERGSTLQGYDADLGVIAGLADPNADRILFWDDSAGAYAYLTAGSGLSIAGTTISASASGDNWTASGTTNSTLAGVAYVHEIVATNGITTSGGAFSMVIEGATADDYETTLTATDPGADNSVVIPNASGTLIVSGHTFTGDVTATVDSDGSTALVIADSVTVTGWALGASTATTPGADDSDTSVATTAFVQGEINGDTRIYEFALGDETTASTTGTGKVTWRAPHAMTVTAVRASVTTAPTGSTLIVDINESGTTILSTKLSIDASEKTSTTAASAAVISDTAIADDAEITFDLDQVGSTVAGAGVKVKIYYTK